MKLTIMLLLIFTATLNSALAGKMISQDCTYSQVEGKRLYKSYGVVLKVCYDKRTVPDVYSTSTSKRCAPSHVAGRITSTASGHLVKNCISRYQLEETYYADSKVKCGSGYSSDKVLTYINGSRASKVCVRDL